MRFVKLMAASVVVAAFAIVMALAQAPQGGPGGPGGGPRGAAGGPGGARQGGGGGRGGAAFNVTSPGFADGAEIPLKFSYYGENVSPQFDFHWFNGMNPAEQPASVQSFAIIFRDMENSTNRGPADTL